MKLLKKVNDFEIGGIFVFYDTIAFNRIERGQYKGFYKFENNVVVDYKIDLFYWGEQLNDLFFWLSENGKDLLISNKNLETVKTIEGEVYFPTIEQVFKDKLKITIGKETFLIDNTFELRKIEHFYILETNYGYIGRGYDRANIMLYSWSHEKIWQTNIVEMCQGLVLPLENDEDVPLQINSQIFSNGDTVFVPLTHRSCAALNANDGSLKWVSTPEVKMAYPVYFDGKLYNNSSRTLEEIDPETGHVLRQITYKDFPILKDIIGCHSEHSVYDDFIVLKDQMRDYVVMIDRLTLEPVECVKIQGRLPSHTSYIQWVNNKLYVLTTGGELFIFEREG